MNRILVFGRDNFRILLVSVLSVLAISFLLLYKLGSLVGGLSLSELTTTSATAGWHGIFNHPLDLPLKFIRSIVFSLKPDYGQTLTRLPNALFGGLAILTFSLLVWLWHGTRTALLSILLFSTSAWVLHASRLASYDVLYLWAIPTLLLIQVMLHRYGDKRIAWYGSLLTWGMLLYIPGMIWLIVAQIAVQRKLVLSTAKKHSNWPDSLFSIAAIVVWLPLLLYDFTRSGHFLTWIGLPANFPGVFHLLKQMFGVPIHLLIRGPQYPYLWLDRAPILDVLTLAAFALGIYFYSQNWKATRSQTLGVFVIIGTILVGLGGPVSLSLLVALAYIVSAAGIAYLLQNWLKVFPRNPLARGLGIGLVTLAVLLSCTYNLRSYFIAWPHNPATHLVFRYHR